LICARRQQIAQPALCDFGQGRRGFLAVEARLRSRSVRGQVTTLLRQLGAEAASTDLLVYYDEKPKKLGWPAESW